MWNSLLMRSWLRHWNQIIELFTAHLYLMTIDYAAVHSSPVPDDNWLCSCSQLTCTWWQLTMQLFTAHRFLMTIDYAAVHSSPVPDDNWLCSCSQLTCGVVLRTVVLDVAFAVWTVAAGHPSRCPPAIPARCSTTYPSCSRLGGERTQTKLAVTCGHVGSRTFTCGHMLPHAVTRRHMQFHAGTCGRMLSHAVTGRHIESQAVHMQSYAATIGLIRHMWSHTVTCGHLRSQAIPHSHMRSHARSHGRMPSHAVTCGQMQ